VTPIAEYEREDYQGARTAADAHIDPFCIRPDGRAGSHRGQPARRAGKTHGWWLADRVGASWQ